MSRLQFPRLSSVFSLVVLATALLGSACKKDDTPDSGPDVTAPVITVTTPESLQDSVWTGQLVHLTFNVSDDRNLSQIHVEAHSAFNGHIHEKTAAITTWSYDTLISVTGRTSFNVTISVPIPDSAATGRYHLLISATDVTGNASEVTEIGLDVTSPSAPTVWNLRLNDSLPAADYTVHLLASEDSLPQAITALVQDDIALQEVRVTLLTEAQIEMGDTVATYWATFINLVGTKNYSLATSFPFRRADLLNNTMYVLTFKVKDTQGNYTFVTRHIHVMMD